MYKSTPEARSKTACKSYAQRGATTVRALGRGLLGGLAEANSQRPGPRLQHGWIVIEIITAHGPV